MFVVDKKWKFLDFKEEYIEKNESWAVVELLQLNWLVN